MPNTNNARSSAKQSNAAAKRKRGRSSQGAEDLNKSTLVSVKKALHCLARDVKVNPMYMFGCMRAAEFIIQTFFDEKPTTDQVITLAIGLGQMDYIEQIYGEFDIDHWDDDRE